MQQFYIWPGLYGALPTDPGPSDPCLLVAKSCGMNEVYDPGPPCRCVYVRPSCPDGYYWSEQAGQCVLIAGDPDNRDDPCAAFYEGSCRNDNPWKTLGPDKCSCVYQPGIEHIAMVPLLCPAKVVCDGIQCWSEPAQNCIPNCGTGKFYLGDYRGQSMCATLKPGWIAAHLPGPDGPGTGAIVVVPDSECPAGTSWNGSLNPDGTKLCTVTQICHHQWPVPTVPLRMTGSRWNKRCWYFSTNFDVSTLHPDDQAAWNANKDAYLEVAHESSGFWEHVAEYSCDVVGSDLVKTGATVAAGTLASPAAAAATNIAFSLADSLCSGRTDKRFVGKGEIPFTQWTADDGTNMGAFYNAATRTMRVGPSPVYAGYTGASPLPSGSIHTRNDKTGRWRVAVPVDASFTGTLSGAGLSGDTVTHREVGESSVDPNMLGSTLLELRPYLKAIGEYHWYTDWRFLVPIGVGTAAAAAGVVWYTGKK